MKTIIRILISLLLLITFSCNINHKKSSVEADLKAYLESNLLTPEDYIIEKFRNHDYVVLGEYHGIKHDVDLVLKMIPILHKNGIYNLGIEFGAFIYQDKLDSLLQAPKFDRKIAREIIFNSQSDWAYKEYIDIYEIAWRVNHEISDDTLLFRVVNLCVPYLPCEKGLDRFGGYHYDKYMAKNVLNEFVAKDQKALIYTGAHHAFTKYYQPIYDFEKDTLYRQEKMRMGNILYDTLKEMVFNIYLHSPWISDKGFDKLAVLPVNGIIDSLMKDYNFKSVGFDAINSPFGKLTSNNTYYAFGYNGFVLEDFCDGYIYQGEISNYKNVTMEQGFVTMENLNKLKSFLICVGYSAEEVDSLTVENANDLLFYDVIESFKELK